MDPFNYKKGPSLQTDDYCVMFKVYERYEGQMFEYVSFDGDEFWLRGITDASKKAEVPRPKAPKEL